MEESIALIPTRPRMTRLGNPVKDGVPTWFSLSGEEAGSPEFTNEVQHQMMVLPWPGPIDSFPWKSAARLPAYTPKGARSKKSLQLWIARHRAFLGS